MGGFRRVVAATALVLLCGLLSVSPASAAELSGPKPTIAGQAVIGRTLTARAGEWSPAGTRLSYQWFRVSGGSSGAIGGATGVSYTVRPADAGHRLAVRVTGSSAQASLSKWSDATAVVGGRFTSASTPRILGRPILGRTLTAKAGTWAPSPVALAYQWYRDGAAISGARGSSYQVRAADLGHRLRVAVTGSKRGYLSATRWSAATAVVRKPSLTRTPAPWIAGTARYARTLTARTGLWGPAPVALSFQWYRGGVAIRGAYRSSYQVRVADLGHRLRVRVTGSKADYESTSRWSAATSVVKKATFAKSPKPRISGAAEVGQTLRVDPGRWGPGRVKLRYQWYCNGIAIKGATKTSFQLRPGDLDCVMRVKATGSKPGYYTEGKRSAATVPAAPSRIQVSAGGRHTCMVTAQGGVLCWGRNEAGALGDGTTSDRLTPVPVLGLSSGVRAVAAGSRHTCALTRTGGVKCWGANNHGQLGDAGTLDRLIPADVVGLKSRASAIFAGYDYSCAVLDSGGVKCWGLNTFARLGAAPDAWESATPVDVIGVRGRGLLADTIAIAPGGYAHTCAITTDRGVHCWGWNYDGELGNGTDRYAAGPVAVTGLARAPILSIGAGALHSCAVTTGGKVTCWGRGDDGQLGTGAVAERHAPKTVPKLKGVASVAVGAWHTCALTRSGGVRCWGAGERGQLGNGRILSRGAPVGVAGLPGVAVSLSAGGGHTCAVLAAPVRDSPKIKCWGDNRFGQLGDGTTGDLYNRRTAPVDVVGN